MSQIETTGSKPALSSINIQTNDDLSSLNHPAAKIANLTNDNSLTNGSLDSSAFDSSFDPMSFFGDDNLLGDSFGPTDDNSVNTSNIFDSLLGGTVSSLATDQDQTGSLGLGGGQKENTDMGLGSGSRQNRNQSDVLASSGQHNQTADGSSADVQAQGGNPVDDFELDQLLDQNSNTDFTVSFTQVLSKS